MAGCAACFRTSMPRRPAFIGNAVAGVMATLVFALALGFFPVPAAAANAANAPQKVCEAGSIGFPTGSRGHPDRPGSVATSDAGFAMLVPHPVGGAAGGVVSWGNMTSHGGEVDWDSDNSKTTKYDPKGSGYTSVVSNTGAFAALNPNGCVRSWGWGISGGLDHYFQGEGEGCGGDALRHDPGDNFHNFTAIFSERRHFVGLKEDGSVWMWGYNDNDGQPTGTGFVAVYTTPDGGFAALHKDGSLYGWGATASEERWANVPAGNDYVAVYSGGVDSCYSGSFVALTGSGFVRMWGRDPAFVLEDECGHASYGPDPSSVYQPPTGSGFTAVYSNRGAFAALHGDRTIHVWGDFKSGGNQDDAPGGGGFRAIYSTRHRFAALHRNGSIYSWGGFGPGFWAAGPNWPIQPMNMVPWGEDGEPQGTGFVAIFSSNNLFVALHENGTIHGFGDTPAGPGFTAVTSNKAAFAALHRDGTIHTWGEWDQDRDSVGKLKYTGCGATGGPVGGGFVAIHSSACAFAAVHQDGSVHTWGHGQKGGRLPWKNLRDHPTVISPSYDGSSAALCADGRAPVDLFKIPAAADAGGAPATYNVDTLALASDSQDRLHEQISAVLEDTAELKSNTLASLEDTTSIKNQDLLTRNNTATIKAQVTTIKSQSTTVLGAVGSLTEAHAGLKDQVNALVEDSAGLKGTVAAVAADTAGLKDLKSAVEAVAADTADLKGLKGTVEAAAEETVSLTAQMAALRSEVAGLPPLLEACTAARRARSEANDRQQSGGGQNSGSAGMIAGTILGLLTGVGLTIYAMGRRTGGDARTTPPNVSNILSFNNDAYEGGGGTKNDAMYADMPGDDAATYQDIMGATIATARPADDGSYLDIAENVNPNDLDSDNSDIDL